MNQVWRRTLLLPVTQIILILNVLLTLTVTWLVYALALNLLANAVHRSLIVTLLALASVTLVLVFLATLQMLYAYHTSRLDRQRDEAAALDRVKIQHFLATGTLPDRLSQAGENQVLLLREQAGEREAQQLQVLYAGLRLRQRDEEMVMSRAHPNLRIAALERLALLADPHSLPTMLRAAHVVTPGGDPTALSSLALLGAARILRRGDASVLELLPVLEGAALTQQQGTEALSILGKRAGPLIQELARHSRPALRALSARGAALGPRAEHYPLALNLLRDPSPDVRAAALRLYVALDVTAPNDLEQLNALAQDPAWFVRGQAVKALAGVRPLPEASLWDSLGDSNWWVRHNAGQALAISLQGQQLLRQALSHPDAFARDTARAALQTEVAV
ncbi:HEAT repeat domain-containing protein [Deinococcus radiophilus]|uniref:HEAT repeat domain-containing protein n=1 Tax=Deinococcus radiophilus TaxID=32062 RepID=A0A3S0I2N9_9DEIO|nr:HEAT repeat domain-containing protein [Deinococcus radiophilus]RTR26015.1 hypothetical protein EJ104_09185 [Deinococcus radiophilus]UFA51858.1 HEAT repeat domain-containing protein [Deinococcus radiophilus]